MADEAAQLEASLNVIRLELEKIKRLGWTTHIPPPREGDCLVIEAGSTGVFRGRYHEHYFFVEDGGDLWPARPLAWKRPKD